MKFVTYELKASGARAWGAFIEGTEVSNWDESSMPM